MPAGDKAGRRTQTYGAIAAAGTDTAETCIAVAPSLGVRTMLLIQNTGANVGLVRFSTPVQGDGSDITFAAGAGLLWDRAATCPEASFYVGSTAGTTFSITEQVTR